MNKKEIEIPEHPEKYMSWTRLEANLLQDLMVKMQSLKTENIELKDKLKKVEKNANFDRLERYVLLLERAANAMHSLAELEASGKLEKIAASIR